MSRRHLHAALTLLLRALPVCFLPAWLVADSPAQTGFPFQDETLHYTVNWPSGLSLGEGYTRARRADGRWEFELTLDAALPGFAISDRYRSVATAELCSTEFERDSTHGRRRTREKTAFDYTKASARRTTLDGGQSEISISGCARDALDFVFYTRRELGQGRVPPSQAVLFGAPYQVRLDYTGAQSVSVNEREIEADRTIVFLKGPASDLNVEIFFARDAARTPVLIRVPFALGTFSMELVR